ncbi:MAG: metallophosphoesterase [Clostridia bacterium]|nr:metallophosphoesterase [Clostridia bacterium]
MKSKSKKILLIIAAVIAVIAVATTIANYAIVKSDIKNAESFERVVIEDQLVPEKDANGYWTFTTDRELKVLQLTDVHLGGGYLSVAKDRMALNCVAAMVAAEKPDLVVVSGDIAFPVPYQAGTFNNYSAAKIFAQLMEKLGVYWTVAFGNHDSEVYNYYNREKVSEFYSNDAFEYCLYESGPADVDGYGNQVINVKNTEGIITQSVYVFDSHSYVDGDYLGIMWKYDNIHDNQVEWYENTVKMLDAQNNARLRELGREENSAIKSIAFLHIPLTEQRDAWYEYAKNGFTDTENVKYHYGVAGESGKIVYAGMAEDDLFEKMLELDSTKALFFGHDHYNNFSIDYKGIRMTYSLSVDYFAYPGVSKIGSQRGCTVITLSPDGSFDCVAQNYYNEKYVSLYPKEEVEMQEIVNLSYDEIKM